MLFKSSDLEVLSLKAWRHLFQPLQDKETNTPACAYNLSWFDLLLCSVIQFFVQLWSVLCVLQFSYIFCYIIWCYTLLFTKVCCNNVLSVWLALTACINQSNIDLAVMTNVSAKRQMFKAKYFAFLLCVKIENSTTKYSTFRMWCRMG